MRPAAAVALIGLALAGCRTSDWGWSRSPPALARDEPPIIMESRYEQETTKQRGPTTPRAVRIYRGDVKLLPDDALVQGTMAFRMWAAAPPDEARREIERAIASRGGTHYLLVTNEVKTNVEMERNESAEGWRAISQAFKERGCDQPNGTTLAARRCWEPRDTSPIYNVRTTRERVVSVVVIAIRPIDWDGMDEAMRPRRLD